ncbi:MAG TPA: hypothetical protein VKE98_22950, partial [Gemmataceae bacterium]|nr:hypothetical protein [Gemmataceae bacterium]
MSSKFATVRPRFIFKALASLLTGHRSLLIGFAGAAALMLPLPALKAQTTPQITILLADPQLGVVGADQSGGNTLFFEARTPAGSTLSARLVDALGRTIAISGHSMDSLWLANADFNAADATQSLSLAAGLPAALAKVLNRTVFPNEYTAISNLASSAAGVTPGTGPAVFDTATAKLATPSQTTVDAAASFDASAAATLASTRDSSGNLSATFGTTALQTFVENFPTAQNDDGTVGITEVSAR